MFKSDDERIAINVGDDGTVLRVRFPVRPRLVRVMLEAVELLATTVGGVKPADAIKKSGATMRVSDVVCEVLPKARAIVTV